MPSITNTATVSFTQNSVPFQKSAQSTITTLADPISKITMTKSASPTTVYTGGQVTYTIRVVTNGIGTVMESKLVDIIPSGLTFVADSVTVDGNPRPSTSPANITLPLLDTETTTVTYKCTVN